MSQLINDQQIALPTESNNSLTHLFNLTGASELSDTPNIYHDTNYGSEFREIHPHKSYYETIVSQRVDPRWSGQGMEASYMNRLKAMNEPEVKAYRDLQLSPIPNQQYESYEPIIYTSDTIPKISNSSCNAVNLSMGNNDNDNKGSPMSQSPCSPFNSPIKCNACINPNNRSLGVQLEPFQSSSTLDIRSSIDTNVGIQFIAKLMFIVIVFYIIYYVFKKRGGN
jgi:hypothetical protein